MRKFSEHYLSKVFTLFTAVIFLNMSFFLAEVTWLKFNNKQMIENIAKLLSTSGFEEERDSEGSATDSGAKEVDIFINPLILGSSCLVGNNRKINPMLQDQYMPANYSQTFSPPPDVLHFS